MNICVYGSASNLIDEVYKKECFKLGQKLAERGHTLVFGGGGCGVMGATAKGSADKNGSIIGIVPQFFKDDVIEQLFEECTEFVLCDTMYDRKELLETRSDAFIVAPGGIGTYDEFFGVLTNKQLGQHTKPIVLYNLNGYYNELKAVMDSAIDKKFIKGYCNKIYSFISDIDEMLDFIEKDNREKLSVRDLKDG